MRRLSGHFGRDVATSNGSRSGIVWLAGERKLIEPWPNIKDTDWGVLPRVLDGGAIVQHEKTKGWLTVYRKIDDRYYRAEVFKRTNDAQGDPIPRGPRLNLETYAATYIAKAEIDIAKSDGRLVRDEARADRNLFELLSVPANGIPVLKQD